MEVIIGILKYLEQKLYIDKHFDFRTYQLNQQLNNPSASAQQYVNGMNIGMMITDNKRRLILQIN